VSIISSLVGLTQRGLGHVTRVLNMIEDHIRGLLYSMGGANGARFEVPLVISGASKHRTGLPERIQDRSAGRRNGYILWDIDSA